jgi:hypothetical protein
MVDIWKLSVHNRSDSRREAFHGRSPKRSSLGSLSPAAGALPALTREQELARARARAEYALRMRREHTRLLSRRAPRAKCPRERYVVERLMADEDVRQSRVRNGDRSSAV